MTQLMENIFAIEVPVDGFDFEILRTYRNELRYLIKGSENPLTGGEKIEALPLPPGNYSFICASLTATEEEAAKIVVRVKYYNRENDYEAKNAFENYEHPATSVHLTAKGSLHSLLRSKGLNPELNYAILRKPI